MRYTYKASARSAIYILSDTQTEFHMNVARAHIEL